MMSLEKLTGSQTIATVQFKDALIFSKCEWSYKFKMWKRNRKIQVKEKKKSTWAERLNVEKQNTEAKLSAWTDTSEDEKERKRKFLKILSIDKAPSQ